MSNDTDRDPAPGQLRRFENKAQLLRYISEAEGVEISELWDEYDRQIDNQQRDDQ